MVKNEKPLFSRNIPVSVQQNNTKLLHGSASALKLWKKTTLLFTLRNAIRIFFHATKD